LVLQGQATLQYQSCLERETNNNFSKGGKYDDRKDSFKQLKNLCKNAVK
jgi:hypothetical protein